MNHTQTLAVGKRAAIALFQSAAELMNSESAEPRVHALRSAEEAEIRPLYSIPRTVFESWEREALAAIQACEPKRIGPDHPATLRKRVYRRPASLGGSFYHLEIGHAVRIRSTYERPSSMFAAYPNVLMARCYCGQPGERLIPEEDLFDVDMTSLIVESLPEPTVDEIDELAGKESRTLEEEARLEELIRAQEAK